MIIEIPEGYKLVSHPFQATHIMVVDHSDTYNFAHEFKKGGIYEFHDTNNGVARNEQGRMEFTYSYTTFLYLAKQD